MGQLSVTISQRQVAGSCIFCDYSPTDIVIIVKDKRGYEISICPDHMRELWNKSKAALEANGCWQ